MANTSRIRIPYPNEFQDPFYDAFVAMMESLDSALYATREDRSSLIMGGGTVSFTVAGVNGALAWSQPLEILSPIAGFLLSVSAGAINLLDGDMLFIRVVRSPTLSQSIILVVARNIPNEQDAILIAIRRGNTVYFRDGRTISHGDSLPLFTVTPGGAPAGTFVRADGTQPLTADWTVGAFKVTGMPTPTAASDAATKAYVDSVASTAIESYGCPLTVAVNDAVYLSAADTVDKASATAIATAPAIGFVISKPSAVTCLVKMSGSVSGFVGLSVGLTYYLDTVTGGITSSVGGFVPGNVVQEIGFARNTTTLVAVIDRDFTVL